MKLVFTGLETPVAIESGKVSVLEIANHALFTRISQSLLTGKGQNSSEPYSLWDGEKELKADSVFMPITNPFDLPWTDRLLLGKMYTLFEKMLIDDDAMRSNVEHLNSELYSTLASLGFQMSSDYGFGLEWDVHRYFKTFSFGISVSEVDSLLDNLIKFINLTSDASLAKVLLFLNLKLFLTENELEQLYEQVFLSNTKILLLECVPDETVYSLERKVAVDQYLLESIH